MGCWTKEGYFGRPKGVPVGPFLSRKKLGGYSMSYMNLFPKFGGQSIAFKI